MNTNPTRDDLAPAIAVAAMLGVTPETPRPKRVPYSEIPRLAAQIAASATIAEAAERLLVTPGAIHARIARGTLPTIDILGQRRVLTTRYPPHRDEVFAAALALTGDEDPDTPRLRPWQRRVATAAFSLDPTGDHGRGLIRRAVRRLTAQRMAAAIRRDAFRRGLTVDRALVEDE
ncbi:hypothetical protein [Gordonia tangerina]|uniref:DNA-binding protein n=1 Tax=Gordonia tangerina TaxID=2911060 RepID=A0ABS9DDV2_9ACTN|nr:hypothetical protein [Gordonia tangerina]MCF3937181.1 hypothetical protein [Gordonia tangerina]